MRKAGQTLVGKVIASIFFGALIVSFAIWGIGDIFRGFGRSTVAKVGGTEITVEQFRLIYNDRLQQIGQQVGRPVTPDQARALADTLDRDTQPDKKFYIYHHYHENCTTRLRDHMDAVTGGKLRAGADVPFGPTYRELSGKGFARSTGLLIGTETLIA